MRKFKKKKKYLPAAEKKLDKEMNSTVISRDIILKSLSDNIIDIDTDRSMIQKYSSDVVLGRYSLAQRCIVCNKMEISIDRFL